MYDGSIGLINVTVIEMIIPKLPAYAHGREEESDFLPI